MIKVFATGRLTADPKVNTSGSGTKYAKFSIASDKFSKKSDGKKEAVFIDCVAFNGTADVIETYLGKGKQVSLSGDLDSSQYPDKDTGKNVTRYQIVIDQIDLPAKSSSGIPAAPKADSAAEASTDFNEW